MAVSLEALGEPLVHARVVSRGAGVRAHHADAAGLEGSDHAVASAVSSSRGIEAAPIASPNRNPGAASRIAA